MTKGTVVQTDGWHGYDDIAKLGYDHGDYILRFDYDLNEDSVVFDLIELVMRATGSQVIGWDRFIL